MPLINGCKYSCEPCIRGHRATSCAHTDRILIKVRKPGRPLESCGHNLNTCQCGRVAEIFAVNDVLSDPSPSPFAIDNSNFVVTTPPPASGSYPSSAKPKSRTKSQSRITKTSKKKTVTSPTSPLDRSSPETTSSTTGVTQGLEEARIMNSTPMQEQNFPLSPPGQLGIYSQPIQYMLPNPQPYQPLSPAQGSYMKYPSGHEYTGQYTEPGGHQILYEQPQ